MVEDLYGNRVRLAPWSERGSGCVGEGVQSED